MLDGLLEKLKSFLIKRHINIGIIQLFASSKFFHKVGKLIFYSRISLCQNITKVVKASKLSSFYFTIKKSQYSSFFRRRNSCGYRFCLNIVQLRLPFFFWDNFPKLVSSGVNKFLNFRFDFAIDTYKYYMCGVTESENYLYYFIILLYFILAHRVLYQYSNKKKCCCTYRKDTPTTHGIKLNKKQLTTRNSN